ncbi:MAG: hypothetical protein EP332_06815 [Bacteroidetes bacterium]|nr:MAG: hypothetical protein EP332_06815 [Bacteroidota bacterium]
MNYERFLHWLSLVVYFPIIHRNYGGKPDEVYAYQATFQANSLGFALQEFWKSENIMEMPGYEEHDVKHVLLQYGLSFKDEVAMQYFEFANGNRSLTVWLVLLFGPLLQPWSVVHYIKAFQRGRRAERVWTKSLKDYLTQPLNALRKEWRLC